MEAKHEPKQIAIVRIAGEIRLKQEFLDTLRMLHLSKKHMCVVVPSTPNMLGMIKKIKDFVTWGEAQQETIQLLQEKRKKMTKTKQGKIVPQPFYRLSPPRGGFERKGIKVAYGVGGALGYRGEEINKLIKRMI